MANTVFMSKTGLIGGEATKLDSIDGDTLTDNDAAFVNVSNVQYIYRLDADSGAAESSPNIIAPDTNPGTKRWILQGLNGASLNMPGLTPTFKNVLLSDLSASLPVFSDGSKALVSKSVADTLTALGIGSSFFHAYITSTLAGVTGDSTHYELTGAIWTELQDTGSDFSNGKFTAPANGIYLFAGCIILDNLNTSHTSMLSVLSAVGIESKTIHFCDPSAPTDNSHYSFSFSSILAMGAGHTVILTLRIGGSTKTVDILGGIGSTSFYGFRLK